METDRKSQWVALPYGLKKVKVLDPLVIRALGSHAPLSGEYAVKSVLTHHPKKQNTTTKCLTQQAETIRS